MRGKTGVEWSNKEKVRERIIMGQKEIGEPNDGGEEEATEQ